MKNMAVPAGAHTINCKELFMDAKEDNAMTQYNKVTALYNIFDKADFIARKRIRNHLQMSGRQCQFLRYHALTRACRIFSKPELMT